MAKTFKLTLLTILFAGSIVISCFGQKKTDWQINGLKGRVKSLTTTEYDATEKFGEPVKGGIKDKTETTTKQFDSNGKIIPPKKGGNTVYKYDTKGNIIEETTYGSDNSTILSKSVFKYDLNGNVIEAVNYNSEGTQTSKEINTYDLKGNLIESKESGNLFNGTINQGQELISKYKYDSYSRIIGYSVNIGDSELASANIKNDENGDVIESTTETFNGFDAKKTFKYTYDAKGNWITKVSYSSSAYMNMKAESKADAIVERVIEYYKEPAEIEKEYNELIAKADSSYALKNFSEALDYYKQSLEIKDEQYPKDKSKETQEKIDEEKRIAEEKAREEKRIAEEKARKEKIEAIIKKGNSFFETQKYKEALTEFSLANSMEASNELVKKINNTKIEIERVEKLKISRKENYLYIKNKLAELKYLVPNLTGDLEEKKKGYGIMYENSINLLGANFSSYLSSLQTLFTANKTDGLKIEDSWNDTDQDALDLVLKFKEELMLYEKFYSAVRTALDTNDKDKLKFLKSSDDPKVIISQF